MENDSFVNIPEVYFNNGELEIALCTYNRPDNIRKIIPEIHAECEKRNISLRIVDASPNTDTQLYIEAFNSEHHNHVHYTKVDSNTLPGYMQMRAIDTSNAKYVWVYADSRMIRFREFDYKVFPNIKNGFDILVFYDGSYGGKTATYDNPSVFLHECFIPFTCTGCSIYRKEIFKCFTEDVSLKNKCDTMFKNNYAFSWMGYVLYALAQREDFRAIFSEVELKSVLKNKKITWIKRFYSCWIDDLLGIVEQLPGQYIDSEKILYETWRTLKLDSHRYCFIGRIKGDMDKDKFDTYFSSGLLRKTGANIKRLKFYAYSPKIIIYIYYAIVKIVNKISRLKFCKQL